MSTDKRIPRLVFAAVCLAVSVTCPVSGQERKSTAATTDDLFRKVGISRISNKGAAPDFTLYDISRNSVSLGSHRGNLVFINFWATWCGPCRDEMPSMERLYRQMGGQGLVMLAVNQKEGGQQVANFMRSHGLTFPALLDLDGRVTALYRVWGLPTTYLIDESGQLIGMKSGPKDWASREVLNLFGSLLAGSGQSGRALAGLEGIGGVAAPLPAALAVKSKGVALHGQQDAQSEVLAKLDRGEQFAPLAKAFSGTEAWYMVKTKAGAIGWIKASEVEEIAQAK